MRQDYYRDTYAEIDLDAIEHNVRQFRRRYPSRVRLMAAVKADAYGHGAVPVSKAALSAGATDLAVAFLDEALELREAGITAPILILGYTPDRGIRPAVEAGVALTVYREESLPALADAAVKTGKAVRVHVKVDTGMGRLGLAREELVPFMQKLTAVPGVHVEGLYTHFACADERDKTYTRKQYETLTRMVEDLRRENLPVPRVHSANSAAAIEFPEMADGMIRLGISMYGYYPSEEVDREAVHLKPALSLKTRIIHLKQPKAGTGISYGKTFVADGTRWIATLPIGYADGFNRLLSNRGSALVRGKKVPVVGRVCMDQTMVDVTDAMPAAVGDEVVLYGQQGDAVIHVDEVARLLGTISYEVTCMIGRRVPRVYVRSGQLIGVLNRLSGGVV
jgi:alanine racemase